MDIVITPIKNPIAIKHAKAKKTVLNVRQTHATYSKNCFLHLAVVNFQQVFLWGWWYFVNNAARIGEDNKKIRFWIKNFTTWQILSWKFYNGSDFKSKTLKRAKIYI